MAGLMDSLDDRMELFSYIILIISLGILWKLLQLYYGISSKNPFEYDSQASLKSKVTVQKERDAVLKQGFKLEKVPSELDAVIIGSGIGGLSVAAILAKAGKKVLVLEQHDQAGGCCHTFIDKGYEFDVGIHYIGEMHQQSLSKTLLDQISDGQIQWEPLSDDFDYVVFTEKNNKPFRYYPILSDIEKQKKNLEKYFPEEKDAIERFYQLVKEAHSAYIGSMILKFLPIWLVKLLIHSKLIHKVSKLFKMNEKSVKDVVDELTTNQTLRDIFCYCFGDYGTVPSQSGFPIQALLMWHFAHGSSYPVGGASEIAHSIIPVIEREGGKVLVRAEVSEILLDSDKKAKGVKVRHGKNDCEIFAPLVISSAGLYNTFLKFLPHDVTKESRLFPLVERKRAVAALSVFVGLDASAEELEVGRKKNFWVFDQNDIDKACVDYISLPKEKFEDADVPLMFLSFPSTKDPSWEGRYPGKTTMAIVTLNNYDWYGEWENEPCQRRGDEYETIKKTVGWKMIDQASLLFPKIKDHIDYVSVGSPLSNNFYLGAMKGEIYGLAHDKSRYSPLNYTLLRPTTDIPGLYLSGQDVCSCGFAGALWGGLLCAQQVLGRNVFKDLKKLHKSIKSRDKMKEE